MQEPADRRHVGNGLAIERRNMSVVERAMAADTAGQKRELVRKPCVTCHCDWQPVGRDQRPTEACRDLGGDLATTVRHV
jgi:hypothetical protein